jgi:hypothetical protein
LPPTKPSQLLYIECHCERSEAFHNFNRATIFLNN